MNIEAGGDGLARLKPKRQLKSLVPKLYSDPESYKHTTALELIGWFRL